MDLFELVAGDDPLVATAIHSGHAMRAAAAQWLSLDEATRLREEDPYTDELAALAPTRLIGRRSRFEFDLNRPRDRRSTSSRATPGDCASGAASCLPRSLTNRVPTMTHSTP
jgi:N-formylglutamate amidohydrolase